MAGGAALASWIAASLAMLAPGGRFVMIHRPDALGAILAAIGGRLGGLALLPVYPALGASAHPPARLGGEGLEGAVASRAGAHPARGDGRLTAEADAIHRGERLLDWGG